MQHSRSGSTHTIPRSSCWPASCASSRPASWRITQGGWSTSTLRCCRPFPACITHQRAIDAGCKVAGASVHLVTPELDAGPILAQGVVPVLPGDTAERLSERVLAQEHAIYAPAVLQLLLS